MTDLEQIFLEGAMWSGEPKIFDTNKQKIAK